MFKVNRIFTFKCMLKNYSLIPTVALTGFACAMAGSYLWYMASSKPDLHFRLFDKDKLPEWSVEPDEYRKLYRTKDVKPYNVELENLRREIQDHYSQH